MEHLFGLVGKRALVVGAGQGIGRAAAQHLATCGARLALVDIEKERVDRVAAELRAQGTEVTPLTADITVEAEVSKMVASAADSLGGLDVLVNIVGMAGWVPLLEMDADTWDREHMLNLKQHFFVCRAVAASMVDASHGGAIVTVASVSGLYGAPNHGAYGAAKAGLMALTKTMAEEWEPHEIRVNTVAPGSVLTPRIRAMREAGDIPTPGKNEADRIAEPDDIAGAILFLASNLARRVNGHTLIVDGGTTSLFPFKMR